MSKLFKLKKWLTLHEAIEHISTTLSEPITEADIFRLALDKHLILSVNLLNGSPAYLGKMVGLEDIEFELITKVLGEPLEKPFELPSKGEIHVSEDRYTQIDRSTFRYIRDVWDLTLIGSEAIDLEFFYQQRTSGLEVTSEGFEGVFVEKDGVVAQLLTDFDDNEFQKGSKAYCKNMEASIDPQNTSNEEIEKIRQEYKKERVKYLDYRKDITREDLHFPSGGLDEHDYVFVIRTSELNRFLRAIDDESLNAVNKPTAAPFKFAEQITNTIAWQELYKLTEKALEEFPSWKQTQSRPDNIPKSRIDDWLMETLVVTKREAETIKKIIIEIFNL
jgi:hypothetical protein